MLGDGTFSSSQSSTTSFSESISNFNYDENDFNKSIYPDSDNIIYFFFLIFEAAFIGMVFYFAANNLNPFNGKIIRHQQIKAGICGLFSTIVFSIASIYVDLTLLVFFESYIFLILMFFTLFKLIASFFSPPPISNNNDNNNNNSNSQDEEMESILV